MFIIKYLKLKQFPNARIEDLTGLKFNMLSVIKFDTDRYEKSGRRVHYWICRCSCGSTISKDRHSVINCGLYGCKLCRNKHRKVKQKYSFEQWCLDNNHQDYLDLWDYELNNKKPDEIGFSSNAKYYFKCSKGIHNSGLWKVGSLTDDSITCNVSCRQCNSFGQHLVDTYGEHAIEKYWSVKNEFSPYEVAQTSGKTKYIHINCDKDVSHGDYKTTCDKFKLGRRCPVCSNHKVIKGINDVATTHPHLVKYFANIEECYKYSHSSNKGVLARCDRCSFEKETAISNLSKNGFCCNQCSDNISYPNKLMTSILKCLNIEFETEKSFTWSDGKIYDHYIPKLNMIIENHGLQHYTGWNGNVNDLVHQQQNDTHKRHLAINNGIKKYIEIDCKVSSIEYIKNSLLNSEFKKMLNCNIEDIDWCKCDAESNRSELFDICILWNASDFDTVSSFSKHINKNVNKVRKYLKVGDRLGLCEFKSKFNHNKNI